MVGGFISEWWATSSESAGKHIRAALGELFDDLAANGAGRAGNEDGHEISPVGLEDTGNLIGSQANR
jgi:hypothetical protein